MDIYKIVLVAIISAVLVVLLRDIKGELAIVVGLASGIILLIMTLTALSDVIVVFNTIVDKSGVDNSLYVALLKIIGIGYLTEFSANICEDAGSKSLAAKVLLGGKIAVMVVALPVVETLLNIIIAML